MRDVGGGEDRGTLPPDIFRGSEAADAGVVKADSETPMITVVPVEEHGTELRGMADGVEPAGNADWYFRMLSCDSLGTVAGGFQP